MSTRVSKWSKALGLPDLSREVLDETVAKYERLKKESFTFLVQTEGVDLNKFNPLSKVAVGNPWASQYDNETKLEEIKLDVDRTYMEIDFFSDNVCHQKSMINIIFVFTKIHKISYRQGMNEICAIFFYAVVENFKAENLWESLTYLLLTHLLMNLGHQDMFHNNITSDTVSPILQRCEKIFSLLEQTDPPLYKHLFQRDVSANLFLVRWIRLLFSREFSFDNIFKIWDWLMESESLDDAIDTFALAMIIHIRGDLLKSDSSGCFMKLLKYDGELDSLFVLAKRLGGGSIAHLAPISPTGNDRVVRELESIIRDLKKKQLVEIASEVSRLEDVLGFVRLK